MVTHVSFSKDPQLVDKVRTGIFWQMTLSNFVVSEPRVPS
jgi:hypothetical protein